MKLTRERIVLVVVACSVCTTSCSGLISPEATGPGTDGGTAREEPRAPIDEASIADVYGAAFQGDADQCATVVCNGAQVCCVVPIPSDAPTEHPDNKCDYDCIAQCMASCPVIALGPAAPSPGGSVSMHGGAVVLPVNDAGVD